MDTLTVTPSASLSADSAHWVSPPQSVLAVVPQAASNGQANMGRIFRGTTAAQVTHTFEARIESGAAGQELAIATILINAGTPDQHALSLLAWPGQASGVQESFVLADGGAQYLSHLFTQSIPVAPSAPDASDGWTQVAITLDLSQHTCGVSLNGTPVLSPPAQIDPSWTPGTPAVVLGIAYVQTGASTWTVRYDNVTVDLQ
jgi:hypothetical protein